jgi:NAD(P)-dependent dehydrogenase (short-subunit alcohol dehydrogenase family)
MANRLNDKVVVITGASSGIGKATALELARAGARLALGARRQPELEDTVAACRKAGAEVVSVPLDVADEAQVQTLASMALKAFGRIDVWFNNAGIDAFGTFMDIPAAAFERVLQVNFMGTVYGSRAALAQFREQGSGVLINNASIVGVCPTPFHSPYVASKFAIRGFSHALRQELVDLPGVHVCTICPSSIDTPLWQRGGNYSGRKVKPLDPVHPVEQVAGVVLALIQAPQREVFAGATGWVLTEQHAADPELTEAFAASFARASLFQEAASDRTDGVLFTPETGNGGVSGGWMDPARPGIAAGDLPAVFAAPALLAGGPALFSWKLSRNFVQQFGMQLSAFQVPQTWTGANTKSSVES